MSTTDPLVISLDSSTTATKAIVVDQTGKVLSQGKREITLHSPESAWFEHDPLDWWKSTNEAIHEAVFGLTAVERGRIVALAMTHQRESFAPFDEQGRPLRRGILWLDGRASDQILKYGTDAIHELSGKPADITPALYKLIWLKEHEPEALRTAHKVIDVHGYLVWNLTGQWTSSVACADSLGLFDIAKQDYDPGLLELAGVQRSQMADLVKPGEYIGQVIPEVREGWGLLQDIAVVGGMGDGQAAGLGAAAVEPDIAYLNLGTAVNSGVLSETYQFGKAYRTLAGGVPDTYVLEILQSSGSYLATWFRQALGNPTLGGRPDPELEAAAAKVSAGCGGLFTLPYWQAVQSPWWDPIARGAQVGWRGSHDRAAMYRSILEAIGIEMARNLSWMTEATGVPIRTIRAMGGGTRSPLWRQIMTDTIGIPITACAEDEIAALGAATAAMAHTGVFGDTSIRTAAKQMAKFGDTTEPDEKLHARYQEAAAIQGKLYEALHPVVEEIHQFATKYPNKAEMTVEEA